MSGARRIIIGCSGSPGSLQALRLAASLAREGDATLVPVLAWLPPGGDLADRRFPSSYLRQVLAGCGVAGAVDRAGECLGRHRAHGPPRRTAGAPRRAR